MKEFKKTAAISSLLFLAACGGDSDSIKGAESADDSTISSSSSVSEFNCSDQMDGLDWNIPKEDFFNPGIAYDSMTDFRDGQSYRTVKIGDQVWMAENLNYADSVKTPSLLKSNWCYNNKVENCAVAGRLYTWAAAIDSVSLYDGGNGVDCGYGKICTIPAKVQGICPDGWHLPTRTEWNALFTEVGGKSTVGKILKSQTGWDGNGTDEYGFSALPAGGRYNNGCFNSDGFNAYFWSAEDEDYRLDAFIVSLYYNDGVANLSNLNKYNAFSVRCLKD